MNHVTILQKQKEAQELEIVDLSNGLAKDDPSIIILNDTGFVNPYNTAPAGYMPPQPVGENQSLLTGAPQPQVMAAGAGPTAPPPEAYAPMPQAFVPVDPNAGNNVSAPPTY